MDKELSLISIVKLLKEKRNVIVMTTVSFLLAAFFISVLVMKPRYSSTAELLVSPRADSQQLTLNQLDTNSRLIKTYESIILSDDILTLVSQDLTDEYTNQSLRDMIQISTIADAQTFGIQATAPSPEQAAEIANTVSTVFQENLEHYYSSNVDIRVISAAKPSSQKSSPILSKNLFNAAVLGLILSTSAIILLELLNPYLRGVGFMQSFSWLELGVVSLTDLTQLTALSKRGVSRQKLIKKSAEQSASGLETVEAIKAKLQLQLKNAGVKTVVVGSAEGMTGKTTLATNLAASFAKSGQKVLLIDANLKYPSLQEIFSLPNDAGLSDILAGRGEQALQATTIPNVTVVTSGMDAEKAIELLAGQGLEQWIARVEHLFDVILFDAGALNDVADAQILLTKYPYLVMLVKQDYTRIDDLLEAQRFITDFDIRVLGYVFDGRDRG